MLPKIEGDAKRVARNMEPCSRDGIEARKARCKDSRIGATVWMRGKLAVMDDLVSWIVTMVEENLFYPGQ